MTDDNRKTYIWVRPISLQQHSSNNPSSHTTKQQLRGAPTEQEEWGWTPGYYTISSSKHCYTLFTSDGGENQQQQEYVVEESQTTKLLERGDLVLANEWEERDFVITNTMNEDDDEYDYDETSSDDDESLDHPENSRKEAMPSILDRVVDRPPMNLIELTHLHEPSVVHALRHRYASCSNDMSGIYTDTGPILLAVNPFKADESGKLYGDGAVERYRVRGEREWLEKRGGEKSGSSGGILNGEDDDEMILGPHVYAVADRTFRTMMTRLHPLETGSGSSSSSSSSKKTNPGGIAASSPNTIMNQSVLVSGESGAGKTVTTKLLMGYLAKLSQSPTQQPDNHNHKRLSQLSKHMSIERRVLESNPIMESFGNARTVRNDNSSRFGKYIEMKFRASGTDGAQPSSRGATLVGAGIETYLLEKVRLVHQSSGERNYHIFYELFSLKYDDYDEEDFLGTVIEQQSDETVDKENLSREELVHKFGLGQYDMDDFALINSSGTYDRRDGVSDSSTFADLCRAMSVMGFRREEQLDVFGVTCALLHASNIAFEKIGEVECTLKDSSHLDFVLDLLGISKEGLNHALCYHEIVVRGETHKKVLSVEQASKGIEALIKATYGTMFNYLVKRINTSVSGGSVAGAKGKRGSSSEASIGILDIFGFESFQINSFEQLCINYCNEALQQQFNRFVLRNEQEEYDREGIPWTFIEFPENQDVLDLIDLKGTGIINILHDQCRTPGASDKSFSMLMYEKCSSHSRFEADSRQVAGRLFAIQHYAGLVEYTVEGFMEKNRDELPKASADLLLSSTNSFVKTIANEMVHPSFSTPKKQLTSPRSGASQRPTVGLQFSAQLHDLRHKIDETSPHYIRCLKPNNMLVSDLFDASLIADQLRCAGVIEAVRVSRLGYPQRYSHAAFITRYRVLGMKAFSKKKLADRKYNPAKALVHTISKQIIAKNNETSTDDWGIQVGKTKIFLRRSSYEMLETLRNNKVSSSAVRLQSFARRIVYEIRYQRLCSCIIIIQCFIRQTQATGIVHEKRRQYNSTILQTTWRRHRGMKYLQSTKYIAKWAQTHYRGSVGRSKFTELNKKRRALQIQTQGRRYISMKKFRKAIDSVIIIQCARRSYLSRQLLSLKKADARDLGAVVQERDLLRSELIALRLELQRKEVSAPQTQVPSTDLLNKISNKDKEIESLREDVERLENEKMATENELTEVKHELANMKSSLDTANSKVHELEQSNAELQNSPSTIQSSDTNEIERLREENARFLEEMSQLKSFNEALKQENADLCQPKPNDDQPLATPPTPVTAEVECALEQALHKIADLEKSNEMLRAENNILRNTQPITSAEKVSNSAAAAIAPSNDNATSLIDIPALPLTSVYTTATTDNLTTDTDDEIAKLREENQVLQAQLELLRDNQGLLPDILGSDQEYEESVNPSETDSYSEEGDESSGFASANLPEKLMKRICSEVEEATEEVIIKTRAESEALISQLESEIDELQSELEETKKSAKYDRDDLVRSNRSLRMELEEATEELSRMYTELEAKTDEFDALNEDVERFAETFAAQHEEVRQLERQVRRLQEENQNLKLLDDANSKRIKELKNENKGKADSVSTPDDQGRLMWKELAKMRKEIANMQHNQVMSPNSSVQQNQGRRGSCSDLSSDEDEEV